MLRSLPVLLLGLPLMLPAAVHARSAALAHPSASQINAVMRTTVEVRDRSEHFKAVGKRVTIKDGRGTGALTAVVGVRFPTADAHGQVVFFWHNARFVGWDSPYEKTSVMRVWSHGPGEFSIKYAHYRPNDPLCCPTLKPITISSGWSGTMFISNGIPPAGAGPKIKITRTR